MWDSWCRTILVCLLFFFFSSRRRHTRFDCDWSSDVCSSDLARPLPAAAFFSVPGVEGQGLAGNWNLFSRLYFKRGAAYVENFAGASPSSATMRELSKTVFQSRYGQKTLSSDAP